MPTAPGLEVTDRIRTAVITALFSVDALYDKLVLKGGNALRLVYAVQDRTSLDLDFSLEGDFPDFETTREALFSALRDRLDSAGYQAFDLHLTRRPQNSTGTWGGYELEFKVIDARDYARLGGNLEHVRRQAMALDARHNRKWSIQISKYESCKGKVRHEIDHHTIFVYSPQMIVIEKLRALCQQLPEYLHRSQPAPRARDFYDIHEILHKLIDVDTLKTRESIQLARSIFEAKNVPLTLLSQVPSSRSFHAPDWPSVDQSILGNRYSFDVYFDYVSDLVKELESIWMEEAPAL